MNKQSSTSCPHLQMWEDLFLSVHWDLQGAIFLPRKENDTTLITPQCKYAVLSSPN